MSDKKTIEFDEFYNLMQKYKHLIPQAEFNYVELSLRIAELEKRMKYLEEKADRPPDSRHFFT